VQTDVLDGCPDNREATGLRREHINLIGALSHVAEEAFARIGRLDMSMHAGRELVKRQQVRLILSQTADRFWIALSILGFEGCQMDQRLLFCHLLPDANQFSLDVSTFSPGDRVEHVALLMYQTALTRRSRKQVRDSREQPLMAIRHDQINVRSST